MARRPLAALLLTLAFAAGCSHPAPAPLSAAPPAAVAAPQPVGLNGTDVAWLQLMIPMDEQGLALLELVPDRTSDPATKRLAAQVGAVYRTELDKLRALRAKTGVSTTNPHEGHDLPGLVAPADLDAARQARDDALNRLVLTQLREQFVQSVSLCKSERSAGLDQGTKALAGAIEKTRTGQLARLST